MTELGETVAIVSDYSAALVEQISSLALGAAQIYTGVRPPCRAESLASYLVYFLATEEGVATTPQVLVDSHDRQQRLAVSLISSEARDMAVVAGSRTAGLVVGAPEDVADHLLFKGEPAERVARVVSLMQRQTPAGHASALPVPTMPPRALALAA